MKAILSPGQYEKLNMVPQQAIGGYSEAPRLIIRERFNNSQDRSLPGSLPPVVLSINNA